MFEIEIAPKAQEDLQWFRKYEQVLIREEIETYLTYQPHIRTRKRKRLEPGHLADWELRIGDIRVFYDVDLDASVVRIARIGYKDRNRLFCGGEEYLP